MTEQKQAMAFYHGKGLVPAWLQAMKYTGKEGRIATMPDIVSARLGTKPGETPWENYFTTLTAEYCGFSKQGNRILIVAHGLWPIATLGGIQGAYKWQYGDPQRNRRGGRITQEEFLDLEAGKFGDVSVIDLDAYYKRYKYAFIEVLRTSEALTDPVLRARLGHQTEKYVLAHAEHARVWHHEQAGFDPENKYGLSGHQQFLDRRRNLHMANARKGSDPFIIQVGDASNCNYGSPRMWRPIEDGYAIAHLVSTGRLCNLHHEGNESLVLDVSCHEWFNGVRLVGIPVGSNISSGIHPGADVYGLLRKFWQKLLLPVANSEPVGFSALVKVGDQWFTQYPKAGESLDTGEPEYIVTHLETISEPVLFRTTIGGYHGFFRYGINEVQSIAPPNANAYFFVTDPILERREGEDPTHQTAMVQFYRATVDTSNRLTRSDALANDYDTLMKLVDLQNV